MGSLSVPLLEGSRVLLEVIVSLQARGMRSAGYLPASKKPSVQCVCESELVEGLSSSDVSLWQISSSYTRDKDAR